MTNDVLIEAEKLAQGARRAVEAEREAAANWGGLPVTPGSAFIDTCGYYTAHTLETLIAEVRRLQAENEAVRDALIDMVGQHCHLRPGQIHDSGLSSDEHACGVLERIGVIRAVDESQHRYEWVEVAADKTP